MGGGVRELDHPVAGTTQDLALAHDHGADRHLATRTGGLGFGKGFGMKQGRGEAGNGQGPKITWTRRPLVLSEARSARAMMPSGTPALVSCSIVQLARRRASIFEFIGPALS
jgi:hypothetical protein